MEEKDKKKEDKSKKKSKIEVLFQDPDYDHLDISELEDLGPDPDTYDPNLPEWAWERFSS
ncbi:MAG: hypothetical protein K5838_08870 [Elusimicrobiales bacterium]|nr:hypothetical protein [Elusimicrobiales bacterium]